MPYIYVPANSLRNPYNPPRRFADRGGRYRLATRKRMVNKRNRLYYRYYRKRWGYTRM